MKLSTISRKHRGVQTLNWKDGYVNNNILYDAFQKYSLSINDLDILTKNLAALFLYFPSTCFKSSVYLQDLHYQRLTNWHHEDKFLMVQIHIGILQHQVNFWLISAHIQWPTFFSVRYSSEVDLIYNLLLHLPSADPTFPDNLCQDWVHRQCKWWWYWSLCPHFFSVRSGLIGRKFISFM